MFDSPYVLLIIIAIMGIAWVALNMTVKNRKVQADEIKSIRMGGYISFLKHYDQAEEAEKAGNYESARQHYLEALRVLKKEEEQDDLLLETISELQEKLANLPKGEQL